MLYPILKLLEFLALQGGLARSDRHSLASVLDFDCKLAQDVLDIGFLLGKLPGNTSVSSLSAVHSVSNASLQASKKPSPFRNSQTASDLSTLSGAVVPSLVATVMLANWCFSTAPKRMPISASISF